MRSKEEIKEYNKQYHFKNKERRRRYNIDNAEKIKEQQKEYKKNNQHIEWNINNAERIKQFKSNTKENRSEVYKRYHMNNKTKTREYKVKKNYGITLDEVHQMFDKQEGKCAICGKHQDELKEILGVDHNHKTNKVRGLLCHKCNRGLGHFNDNIKLLEQAINYLINNL